MAVIGLTGGIGSGKSALAKWIVEHHFDVTTWNADEVNHALLEDEDIKQIVGKFGEEVLSRGGIDRAKLAQIVFHDSPSKLKELQDIIWPILSGVLEEEIHATKKHIIVDSALLYELEWDEFCHAVIFVHAPWTERVRRVESRGWTEQQLIEREKRQLPLRDKRNKADFIVENNTTISDAGRQFEIFLEVITKDKRDED